MYRVADEVFKYSKKKKKKKREHLCDPSPLDFLDLLIYKKCKQIESSDMYRALYFPLRGRAREISTGGLCGKIWII